VKETIISVRKWHEQVIPTLVVLLIALGLVNCEITGFAPPPVTAEMAMWQKNAPVDLATLETGRMLFVSRCIECHTLPPVSRYDAVAWPWLVDDMAKRASLKSDERKALLSYLLAARAQVNSEQKQRQLQEASGN
jgi:hypothetical protein